MSGDEEVVWLQPANAVPPRKRYEGKFSVLWSRQTRNWGSPLTLPTCNPAFLSSSSLSCYGPPCLQGGHWQDTVWPNWLDLELDLDDSSIEHEEPVSEAEGMQIDDDEFPIFANSCEARVH